jgi:hypothetical protein
MLLSRVSLYHQYGTITRRREEVADRIASRTPLAERIWEGHSNGTAASTHLLCRWVLYLSWGISSVEQRSTAAAPMCPGMPNMVPELIYSPKRRVLDRNP